MNQSFASQSAARDPQAPLFFSKVVTRGDGEERISAVIRQAADGAIEIGLHNHAGAVKVGNERATLGFKLPASADGEAFVDDLLAAYVGPVTLAGLMFGWYAEPLYKHEARYDESVDRAFLAHLLETGEVSPENNRGDDRDVEPADDDDTLN